MVYEMTFQNSSKDDWNRFAYGASLDAVMQNLTQSPTPVMKKKDGSEAFAINQALLKVIAQGYIDLYCVWMSSVNSSSFVGIKIHAPVQVFELGYRPTWSICDTTTLRGEPVWEDRTTNISEPFTFPNLQGPYTARATPVSGHSSITIGVRIQDKP